MSSQVGIDQLVTGWLQQDGDSIETPARLLEHALDQVGRTDQERYVTQRLFGDRRGRAPATRRIAFAAVLAAAAMALALLGSLAVGNPLPAIVRPTPTAASSTLAASTTPLPSSSPSRAPTPLVA